jgi:mRNA-degrading endonuclease RelE of RelBE toxin-antitoxin system
MPYEVMVSKKSLKSIRKMPSMEQMRFDQLAADLRKNGPIQKEWPNYSRLSETKYHCHLSYKWVACWRHRQGEIRIEVYYAGSRENAPYQG